MSTVLHIVIGLVIGVAAFFFLVLPANEKALNEKHNQEMIPYLQKLNNASQQYETLKNQYDELDESAAKVQAQLDELVNGNTSVMVQYQSLIGVLQAYRAGDMITAAKSFADADFSLITDEAVQAIVNDVRADMTANVYQVLVTRGTELWNAGNTSEAMEYYQASLKIKPDNPEAMFYVGRLYQIAGDTDNANAMFDQARKTGSNMWNWDVIKLC